MPTKANPAAGGAARTTKRAAPAKSTPARPAADAPEAAGRKPRTRKVSPAATATVEVVTVEAATVEAVPDVIRVQHDQLLATVAEAERRVAELRREAEELRREADAAAEAVRGVGGLLTATRTEAEAVRDSTGEADAAVRAAREGVEELKAEAARARAELDAAGGRWLAIRGEAGSLEAALDHVRRAVVEARAAVPVAPAVPSPEPVPEPTPPPLPVLVPELADVEPLPADEVAADARDRLVRYLNDAAAVEREQGGLLQTLADATDDAGLRAEYERHRATGEAHRDALDQRVRALGGEPAGGRGLLGQLVTRIWDALQKPRDAARDPVEDLLKAVSAAEFEAGMYRAVHALARAVGDGETADLAAAHHRAERDFADALRARIAPAAARAAAAGR